MRALKLILRIQAGACERIKNRLIFEYNTSINGGDNGSKKEKS
jgi:hypothetical protein